MNYALPAGSYLGEVLGIQFNHAPGIKTVGDTLIEWPVGLGAQPSQANVTSWANAQATGKADRLADAEYQAAKMLRAFAIALKSQIPALNLATLASDTKAAYKNL